MHLAKFSRRLLLLGLFASGFAVIFANRVARLDGNNDLVTHDETITGRDLLESCSSSMQCSIRNRNSYCTDGQCFCAPHYVMLVKEEELRCFAAAKIGEQCNFNEQCQSANIKTICVGEHCQCKASYKNHPECRLDHKLLSKHISMSYLINTVMATVVGLIVFLFLLCVICFKCQKLIERFSVSRQMSNPSRNSVMSANVTEKPPSYDEIYIGTTVHMESPTLLRPPSYNQVFVYGEVAVPGNYPATALEDFPCRR